MALNMTMSTNSSVHLGLSITGFLAAIAMVVITLVISNTVLWKGCDVDAGCQSMLFITTTFLSSRRIETSLGFPVATERDLTDSLQTPFNDPVNPTRDRGYRFGHFLECMYTARMADKTCAPTLSFNEYAACIQNSTLIPGALDTCAAFPSSGGYSHWPTAEEYISCVWNNPLLQNSESRRASQNVFRYCVEQSLWPFFEVPQSIDSPVIFGSYNWGLLILAGTAILSSFSVYTCSFYETGMVKRGEARYFMRLGLLSSLVAFVWNFIFFIIFLVASFRNSGEFQYNGGLPTTFSTSFVTLVTTGAAVLYFFSVVFTPFQKKFVAIAKTKTSEIATIEMVPVDTAVDDQEQQMLLKSTFPILDPSGAHAVGPADQNGHIHVHPSYPITEEDVAKFYTPPMLAIWSDSYMADFCLVLGFAGATGQMSTDVAWQLFSLIFVYRLLNMIISRCISDAFTNNVKLSDVVNDYKNHIVTRPGKKLFGVEHANPKIKDLHIGVRVIGLSTQLSALFLYIGVLFIVFNENSVFVDFPFFKTFMIVSFAVPEALRLLVHLYYQVAYDYQTMGNVPWGLYNSFYAIWLWDVVLRLIYVALLVIDAGNAPGTFDFLKTQTGLLMRDYVRYMAI
jgi:hypothetical protein